jgi:hypothetical protein
MFKTGLVQPLAHVTEPRSNLWRTKNKLSTLVRFQTSYTTIALKKQHATLDEILII